MEIPLAWRPTEDRADLRALIRRISAENPLWGAPRIHGELLKLGFEVAQSSVAKYMVKRCGPPSQGWCTFVRNNAPDIAAMDLFVVPTIGFDDDIAARTVYLPNGRRLEAHSGLGSHMDDARHVNLKGEGPTPPNTYKVVMHEEPFHGVRAIRLVPVGDGKMFGRDGLLAHSYMLGPNGQSNGCVSFSDYPPSWTPT